MNALIDPSFFVNVTVNVSPLAIPYSNFGLPMIAGDSNVIDVSQRFRQYTSLLQVANDFGTTAPEYLGAQVFFEQSPQPALCLIGRWASASTPGILHGATLTGLQQQLSNFTGVTTGAFFSIINGVPTATSGVSFATALNLNAVAAFVQAALPSPDTCTWDSEFSRFEFGTGTTVGVNASFGYGAPPTAVGDFSFSSQPTALTDSISINGVGIEFISSAGTVIGNNQVKLGSTLAGTLANLLTFVQSSTIAGLAACRYSLPPTGTTFYAYYGTAGAGGNSIALLAGTQALQTFTETTSNNFVAGDTVHAGNNTFTFVSTIGSTAGNVLIGANFVASATNLQSAIMGTAGAGAIYVAPTAVPNVTMSTPTASPASTFIIYSLIPGTGGNALASVYTAFGTSAGSFGAGTLATGGASGNVSASGATMTGGSGTDVSTLLGMTAASGASPPVQGLAAETPLACATALANASPQWYGLSFCSTVQPAIADHAAVAAFILASSRLRIYGISTQSVACLDPTQSGDVMSSMQVLNNKRVFCMYSSTNAYSCMTLMGRAFTVNFFASNSTLTLAWKQAPGITAETLNQTQFSTLIGKGGNVVIAVDNGAQMIWPGQMENGYWFDEVQNVDWQTNDVQTNVFNLLYQTTTKVPQTDPGDALIATVIENSLAAGVYNGMTAPGSWNAAGFGSLNTGDFLPLGYYVWYPPISTQSQANREARISVPFQCAVKLAGAVHTVSAILNINR